jgi:hypothetical protein
MPCRGGPAAQLDPVRLVQRERLHVVETTESQGLKLISTEPSCPGGDAECSIRSTCQECVISFRVDPPPEEGEARRVPPEVHERVLEGLRHRFDPCPREYWEAIDITSVSSRLLLDEFARINSEVHRRLGEILDEIEPDWRHHYVLIPALRGPHESPLPHRLP